MRINGVFEGGGVRGVALAGAAAAALDRNLVFDHVVGTSAGSLVASLLAAGYTADELSAIVCDVDWPGLLDSVRGRNVPGLGRHIALLMSKGLYKGDRLERVWSNLLAAKSVRTFGDLPSGRLTVVVTDLNHAIGVALPDGLVRYGVDPASFPVARAVRMSSAAPFLFKPVPVHDRITGETVLMADGALAANYPVGLARQDVPVIGFRLEAESLEHAHEHVRGPASLARSVVVAGIRARYSLPRVVEPGAHVIAVPVSADLDFDMSGDEARELFDRARTIAAQQLAELQLELSS